MISIGQYNELKVKRQVEFGVYLSDGENDILLPQKFVAKDIRIGSTLNVFIYKDSEDRLIATTLKPLATVGEFAYLEAKQVNAVGAFLDWGLEKDLFVPFREQEKKMEPGFKYIVYIYVDSTTDRIAASAKINRYIERDNIDLQEDDVVDLLIVGPTDMGFNAIINNKYMGLIFKNEIFSKIKTGDKTTGYVKRIREDNKIDLSLQKRGFELVDDSKRIILSKLKDNGGFLPLSDSSSPEDISSLLKISKKAFKKTIGSLYKEQVIEITDKGIKLITK